MKDEFQRYGNEYSNNVPEFQYFKPVRYYATQEENKDTAGEMANSRESSADDGNINKTETTSASERMDQRQEQFDRANQARNSADGTKSPDTTNVSDSVNAANGNGGETIGDGGAAEAEAAASGSASASSAASAGASASTAGASTVASLAGSVSVVAVAAVAVTAVASGIVHAAPTLVSEVYTKGTDYLTYEIKLKEVTVGADYVIRVSGNGFSAEYPVDLENSIEVDEKDKSFSFVQRQIVTGLKPYKPYTVEVLERYGEEIEIVYFSKIITTDTLPKPKTAFQFTPTFNFDEGNFDIAYEIFVSDYYDTSTDFNLQIYTGETLLVDDYDLGEDYFFRGVLEGLTDLSYLEANVYCTYYDFTDTLIGTYGYRPEYPKDFVVTPSYQSVYDVKTPSVSYTDEGYKLSIDTGFVAQSDEDSYIIDIYKAEEKQANSLNAEEKVLLASYEGRDKVIDVVIPGNTDNIDVYFTGVKTKGDKVTKFDSKKIYSYSFAEDKKKAPEPTASIEFIEDYDTIDDIYNVDYKVNVTDIFNTGSNYKIKELIDNEIVNEIDLTKKEYESSFNTLPNGVNIAVIVYSNYNDGEEQIIIGSDEKKIEYPEPFKDIEYLFKKDSYSISLAYSKEDANKTFNLNVVQNNKDNAKAESNYEFVDVCNYEATLDGIVMSEIESFNFTITYNDNIIKKLLVYPNGSSFVVGDLSADEDGNIIIPYEIMLPTGGEFDSATVRFNESEEVFELNKTDGTIKLTSFDSNILKPVVEVKYTIDDSIVTAEIAVDDINIGAEYEVSYYASHYNSFYDYINIRFDAKLDGKVVNINMAPMISSEGDSGIEYINIADRSLEGLSTGMYQNYYIVKAISIGDDYGISYKVTNEGFDSTEHSITINKNIALDNDLNLFRAGYIDNSEYIVKYAKTLNEDGTANYYFDTDFNETSPNHYGRIEYSYTEDNVTKYLYSDFYNTKTISLLNVKDREYDFNYSIYYLDNNTYYDLDLLEGSGKIYRGKEIKISGVEETTASIAKLKLLDNDEERVVVCFELYDSNIDKTKPITLTYNDTVINITLPELNQNTDGVMTDDVEPLVWTSADGNYGYTCVAQDDIYRVEAYMKTSAIAGDIPMTAKLNYYAVANDFIDAFDEMVGKENLQGDVEKIIGEYTGKYNINNVEITHEDASGDDKATITVSGISYTRTDDRDYLMVVAYSDGEAIMNEAITSSEPVTLYIDPAYSNVTVKLVEVKNEYVSTINEYDNAEMYTIEFNTTLLDEIEFNKVQVIKDVGVFEDFIDEEYVCNVRITPNLENITSFDDYNMGITYYYEANNSVNFEEVEDIENNSTEASFTLHDKPVKVKVYTYKTDYFGNKVIYDSIEVPFNTSITFGSVDVNDDGFVVLPYELALPEGGTLISGSDTTNMVTFQNMEDQCELSGAEGNIIIKEINSNILHPRLEVNYSYNNVNVYQGVFVDDIDLGADIEVSYYASHFNSAYNTVNIKFDATIDGKNVNSNIDALVYSFVRFDDETDEQIYEYVSLEDRESPGDIKFQNGYYVVKTKSIIERDEQEGTYTEVGSELKYKINAEGFDDTEHSIMIDSTINQYTDSNLIAYRAGTRSEAVIDYVKTNNEDGTVNYYFITNFSETAADHYGRIIYSYVADGITRYLETELTKATTIKLENISDKEYTFLYQAFYKKDNIYYDLDVKTIDDQKDDTCFTCNQVTNAGTLNLNNASIGIKEEGRNVYSASVMFDVEPDNLDKENPITVTYASKEITVEYKEYNDEDQTMQSLGDGAYQYAWTSEDTNLIYLVNVRADVIEVEATFKSLTASPNTATVAFSAGPNDFVSLYTELNGTNDIKNYQELSGSATVTVGEYTGKYNVDNFQDDISADSTYANRLTIITDFEATDSRDSLIAIAYYKGEEIARTTLSYGQLYFSNLNPGYTTVDVKIMEVKSQEFVCETIDSLSEYQIEYETIDYKTYNFDQAEYFTSISAVDDEDNITINVSPVDSDAFNDYYLKVEQFYRPSATASVTSVIHTGELAETTVEFNKQYETTKAVIYVYKHPSYGNDSVMAIYELEFDADIGDYIYNDNDDYISLPVELKLPEGATLDTTTSVTYMSQDPQFFEDTSKNIVIQSLDSNVVELNFNVQYSLGDTAVSYRFTKKHTINSEVSLDYAVYSVLGNSSYGSFSCDESLAKYDSSTDTVYIKDSTDGIYYDSDGNEAPQGADSKWTYNTMYYLKGELKANIGCFTNLPYQGAYTVSVQKAGQNIINTSTGSLKDDEALRSIRADQLSTYMEQSSDISGINITFLHTTQEYVYYDYDVHGINKCELEFEIFVDGEAMITKSLEFTEIGLDTIPDSDSFSINRSSVNSSITKNQDDTINMTINTGFDSQAHPNYVYKVELHEKLNYYGYDHTKLYESDYTSSDEVVMTNVKDTNYEVYITVYNVQNGNYIMYESYNIGRVNSPIDDMDWKYDSSAGTYTNIIYLDTSFMNPDYLNGNKNLSFKSGTIDLTNTSTSQSVASNTVTVENQGNGILKISITSTNSSNPRGNLVIEQGNSEIGYTEITYSI